MRKHKLTDDLEIHFIELPKWHKGDVEKMNRLEHWLAYLSPKTTNEERRRLAMKDPAIRKVMEAEKVFLADLNCITAYEQHEKYLRDMAAMKEYDEEVGWERGHAAGLMEERVRLVLKCYRESMSAAAILTALPGTAMTFLMRPGSRRNDLTIRKMWTGFFPRSPKKT